MIDLTAFQQLILLDVAIRERQNGEEPHGLAIKNDLTQMLQEAGEIDAGDEVNHGRLYPNLDKLVARGLLEKGQKDKRTNWYSLSEDGSRAITSLEHLIHAAQGKDAANPFVPAGHAVDGVPKAPAGD